MMNPDDTDKHAPAWGRLNNSETSPPKFFAAAAPSPAKSPATLPEGMIMRVVCRRLADGVYLKDVCLEVGRGQGELLAWIMEDEGRRKMYRLAMELAAHVLAAEAIEIADMGDARGVDPVRDKMRIEARQKFAAQHAPDVFGKAAATVVNIQNNVAFDAGLVGAAAELLAKRRTVEGKI